MWACRCQPLASLISNHDLHNNLSFPLALQPSFSLLPALPSAPDHMKEMKVSLEHLIFLPPNSALALLLAVWPICRRGSLGVLGPCLGLMAHWG